jgi:hypothetical protein
VLSKPVTELVTEFFFLFPRAAHTLHWRWNKQVENALYEGSGKAPSHSECLRNGVGFFRSESVCIVLVVFIRFFLPKAGSAQDTSVGGDEDLVMRT